MQRLGGGLAAAAVAALALAGSPAHADDDDAATGTVPPPADAPALAPTGGGAAVSVASGPGDPAPPQSAGGSTAADMGYEADDPVWIAWVSQFDGLEWEDIDWSTVEPLPPLESGGDDGAVPTADDTGHIGWGTCGWWWKLDWDPAGAYNPDEDLDVTYGLGATCNFPDVIYPAWDSKAEASLYDAGGTLLDTADLGADAWDCPDCDGLSAATVALDWPNTYRIEGWSQILLYPGCDISGCGDPSAWWFWGEVPDGCRGTATPLLECSFATDLWHIGDPVCGDGWSGGDDRARATILTFCSSGPRIDVSGTVSIDYGNDGYCAYVWVWFADGVSEWAGTCDPARPESFRWSHLGRVVAVSAWSEYVGW